MLIAAFLSVQVGSCLVSRLEVPRQQRRPCLIRLLVLLPDRREGVALVTLSRQVLPVIQDSSVDPQPLDRMKRSARSTRWAPTSHLPVGDPPLP
jgi:hypothetical protein